MSSYLGNIFIALTIIIHLYYLNPIADSKIYMDGGYAILHGQRLYTDFIDNKPPLIYLIACVGYLCPSHPFVIIRIIEIALLFANLFMLGKIARLLNIDANKTKVIFCILYLIFWDRGFLCETFNIPLVLYAALLYLRNDKRLPVLLSMLMVISFYLKPNSIVVIGCVAILDIMRGGNFVKYLIYAVFYFSMSAYILARLGLLDGFIKQVFWVNLSNYHLIEHGYLFYTGVIVFTLFHAYLIAILFKKKNYPKELISAILIYFIALPFSYITLKTFPHYFLLQIVPATIIISYLLNGSHTKRRRTQAY